MSKNVQNDREAHDKLQKIHTDCWRRLHCRTGAWSQNRMHWCGQTTHSTRVNKTSDWIKHWLMLQGCTALNTMYRKTPQKQTTFRSPKGNEKQIGYMLTKRRYLTNNKDAEASDMIHMGSDHRCVMATFTITTPEKSSHYKTIKGKHKK